MSFRKKLTRATQRIASSSPQLGEDPSRSRETEALRALVRALARDAARETFERALAMQEQARLENRQ